MATRHLTVYLMKPSVREFDEALDAPDKLESYKLLEGFDFDGRLYVQTPVEHTPPWESFLAGNVRRKLRIGRNRSTGAVLVIKVAKRLFAFTFGHARHLLRQDAFERDFGLKVVVNRVEPKKLRSIGLKRFQELAVSRDERASGDASLGIFGVDVRQDLLRAVTGTPKGDLAKSLTGSDSLIFRADIEFSDLGKKCQRLLDAYNDKAYKQGDFKWIDNLRAVRDNALVAELDAKLVATIKSKDPSCVQMLPPDDADPAVSHFEYPGDPAPDAEYATLDIREWRATLGDALQALTAEELRHRRVRAYTPDSSRSLARLRIYDCLAFETTYKKKKYILSEGNWFEVSKTFDESIREYVVGISRVAVELPDATADDSEPAYITRVRQNGQALVCLHGGSQCRANGSEIEPCDFFSEQRHLVHLKVWSGSKTFSHLLAQGAISAETLLRDPEYREQVHQKIVEIKPELNGCLPAEAYAANRYQVVWGLIGGPTKDLPFFSRLNLLRHGERVQSLGYRVCLQRIPRR